MRTLASLGVAFALASLPVTAHADELATQSPSPSAGPSLSLADGLNGGATSGAAEVAVEPDVLRETNASRYAIDRTTLYGDDARVPQPWVIIATSSVSYTNVGSDPTYVSSPYPNLGPGCYTAGGAARTCYSTFSNNTAQPGVSTILTAEMGIFPRVSILGNFMIGGGIPTNGPSSSNASDVPNPDIGGTAAVRVNVFPYSWTHLHGVVSGGYVREAWNPPVYNDDATPAYWIPGTLGGTNGGYFQLAMSGDIGRFRLDGMFHGQHTFAPGRDPLDITVDLNASFRIVGRFRAGLEYVGQDLEETFSPGAEGGPRHFLGPVASIQAWNDRITVIGGPALGLSAISPDFVARVAASVAF
jgi:hypothetical protein